MSRFDPRRFLGLASVYDRFSALMNGRRARQILSDTHIRALPGNRLIDIGCGPGSMRPFLPEKMEYWGFDASAPYIRNAQARFADRGTFVHAVLTPDLTDSLEPFDIAIAVGLLHHLDDAEARILFQAAYRALKPGARFVTCDGAFTESQNVLARTLLTLDRGQYVRTPDAYSALAREVFDAVDVTVRDDLMAVPYTHCLMVCRR